MKRFVCLMSFALLITACGRQLPDDAALLPLSGEMSARWGVPERIMAAGTGNLYRVVTGKGLGASEALELSAGGQGTLEYYQEIAAGPEVEASYRLQFLSTQGSGRVKITAVDEQGTALASVGWVFTGALPAPTPTGKWLDVRYQANYIGDWVSFHLNLHEVVSKYFSVETAAKANRYRFSIETGQGQHALISQMVLSPNWSKILQLTLQNPNLSAHVGDTVTIDAVVENRGQRPVPKFTMEMVEPYGSGVISMDQRVKDMKELLPGEKRKLSWQVKAQRPDAVNCNKPWQLTFKTDGKELPVQVKLVVSDQRPGRIFYVMTDDLEPIDAAGYPRSWGNANGWLDPEEFLVQMVQKAERLNGIAEQYGAKWTHYIAWPAISAAEWATGRSTTGKWPQVVAAVKSSVRHQTAQGHEYSPHLHIDYDPNLPGNVLSYNAEVDGLWANHLRHGWAHSIQAEGDYDDRISRTGTLYYYKRILDELSSDSPLGEVLTARVGSFDFGNGSESEAMSSRVYRKIGLWGTSDADGNAGGITAAPYGREIYFAKQDDINRPADDIRQIGLVEFRPTPQSFIQYDSQTPAELNIRADEGMRFFTEGGKVKPGVHGIIGFTHTMFVMGNGDWRSTQGGQFLAVDDHLRYLKTQYVDRGMLLFGTATDLVKAYLDYYSPEPVAVYGNRVQHNFLSSEYEIQILGGDIPVAADRPRQVSIKYPLHLRDSAYRISILKNGQEIYATTGLPTPYNDIAFIIDDKSAAYHIKIYHNAEIMKIMQLLRGIKGRIYWN
jgi:hypothetical protein